MKRKAIEVGWKNNPKSSSHLTVLLKFCTSKTISVSSANGPSLAPFSPLLCLLHAVFYVCLNVAAVHLMWHPPFILPLTWLLSRLIPKLVTLPRPLPCQPISGEGRQCERMGLLKLLWMPLPFLFILPSLPGLLLPPWLILNRALHCVKAAVYTSAPCCLASHFSLTCSPSHPSEWERKGWWKRRSGGLASIALQWFLNHFYSLGTFS